jgi:hypothetical protein
MSHFPVSQGSDFTNPSPAPLTGNSTSALLNQNTVQPGVRTVAFLDCTVELPAGTTEDEIQELQKFTGRLDSNRSRPKFKDALKFQRSPVELLKFLINLPKAVDTGASVAFGNSRQFIDYYYVYTCTGGNHCTKVIISPKEHGVCRNCQAKTNRQKRNAM